MTEANSAYLGAGALSDKAGAMRLGRDTAKEE